MEKAYPHNYSGSNTIRKLPGGTGLIRWNWKEHISSFLTTLPSELVFLVS